MNQQASVLRTGRKFDQVLAGAREVFLADGFEGASVDNIAKAAGVSKATLYSYFPDKRVLFMEVVRSVCVQQSEASLDLAAGSCGPREV
ncbi:TetR/AcrR family transcriptional regulator, partial [Leisingera sp. F5]